LLTPIKNAAEYNIVVHGTTLKNWELIKTSGLKAMSRQHIHFAIGYPGEGDVISGMRRSCEVFIEINLEKAIKDGIEFFVSTNKVVLTRGIEGLLAKHYFKCVKSKNGVLFDGSTEKALEETKLNNEEMEIEEIKGEINQIAGKSQGSGKSFDYLVVLDFEAQCIENQTLDCQEIVEFPSVIVDIKNKKIVDIFQYYIKPVIHPKLYPFCTQLTGITQEQVDKGILLENALDELDKFLVKHNILTSNWTFVTCGHWDLQNCLRKECIFKNIEVKDYMRSWINIKENYPLPADYKGRKPDMVEMLQLSKLELDGRHHSGIDDTKNIAKIVLYLLEQGFEFKRSMISNISYKYKKKQ